MHVLEPLIARLQESIALCNRVLPFSSDPEGVLRHRKLDKATLDDYQYRLANAPEVLKRSAAPPQ